MKSLLTLLAAACIATVGATGCCSASKKCTSAPSDGKTSSHATKCCKKSCATKKTAAQ